MTNASLEPKALRLLSLCDQFQRGDVVRKADMARVFHVTERSVQRDIEDLRCFFPSRSHRRRSFMMGKSGDTG